MPRYVLVYTKQSKKKEVGKVVTYDKEGVIGIFHRKAPLTQFLEPGQLVIARILSMKGRNRHFYILYPVHIVEGDRIPSQYDRNLEIWGEEPYKELRRRRMRKRASIIKEKLKKVEEEIDRFRES